ncbi:SGNH/GDSL hydrolase family protein [Devosia sp. BK]|uniref:SGNH/GDSL hydrolase family protein n=1 Tax=Devosia sp. BK TaxID=2871706 RepID=UPI00293A1D16|nr:SGNH/GDSL hydrolase family protein [Devosia sp. BK]MDV3249712.1 SGNH/GDSL hydrolase family protein [Devosia sp. BK]
MISDDYRWFYPSIAEVMYYQNAGFSTDNALYGNGFMRTGGNMLSRSPKTKTSPAAASGFASYSAAPTVETVLIDFNQDWGLRVEVNLGLECGELIAFSATFQSAAFDAGGNPARSTTVCSDSLTEGSGSTTNNDVGSQLGKLRPGRPILNEGMGGQVSEKIIDRAMASKIRAKYWDAILWIGTNDAGPDGAAWFATVDTQIQRFLANRSSGARHPLITGLHPQTTFNGTYKTALQNVNSALAAKYGGNFVSTAALLDGNGDVQAGVAACSRRQNHCDRGNHP